MVSYKIRRLDLPTAVISVLEKQNIISCKDVLSLSRIELQTLLGLSSKEIEKLIKTVSKKCIKNTLKAYDLFTIQESSVSNGFLPLSLHVLDLLLYGGLPLGTITELTGPPGVGKTQFSFLLSILACVPPTLNGLNGCVVFIDTESAFSASRLKSMAEKRFPSFFASQENISEMLQKISVYKVNSVPELKEATRNLEQEIIRNGVKLVVIDSIASLMRKEFGTNCFLERNKVLLEQAAILKDLARTYSIVVFLTNQITSHFVEQNAIPVEDTESDAEDNLVTEPAAVQGNEDHVVPALGNTWAHCVNTRLVAHFQDSTIRKLVIAKSPLAPNASVRYVIGDSGIVLTDDDIEFVTPSGVESILTKYNFLTVDETGS